MKKVFYPLACCLAAGVLVSCSGQKKSGSAQEEQSANEVALSYSKSLKAAEMDSLQLPVDADGYITIFDGKTFNGWRGYGKDRVPSNGLSKTVASNLTVPVAVKRRMVMAET